MNARLRAFRAELNGLEQGFQRALPPHITVGRFRRVLETAVQGNQKLLVCDRQSLFRACMEAAQDGLLPDGRQGAIVPYKDKENRVEIARWMPMIAGIRQKVRNSGELTDWNVQVVQEGDLFEYQLGDEPFIRHKPSMVGGRTRRVIAAYSIATYPNGGKSREVMNVDQIEDVRKMASKAAHGPWSNPVYYPEMCRKTVARLHAKQLPMSTDLERVLSRDDDLFYHPKSEPAAPAAEPRRPQVAPPSTARMLENFAGPPDDVVVDDFDADGVVIEADAGAAPADAPAEPAAAQEPPTAAPGKPTGARAKVAPAPGAAPGAPNGVPILPRTVEAYRAYFTGELAKHTDAEGVEAWFASTAERNLRNACGVTSEVLDQLKAMVHERCEQLASQQDGAGDDVGG
jgi:recombination protein RecT